MNLLLLGVFEAALFFSVHDPTGVILLTYAPLPNAVPRGLADPVRPLHFSL
jgi:hypothetical protein